MDFFVIAVFVALTAVFLLFLRDVIASGVRRGILAAHEVLDAEKNRQDDGTSKE